MQAADRIFDGKFDHIKDEEDDIEMRSVPAERARMSVSS